MLSPTSHGHKLPLFLEVHGIDALGGQLRGLLLHLLDLVFIELLRIAAHHLPLLLLRLLFFEMLLQIVSDSPWVLLEVYLSNERSEYFLLSDDARAEVVILVCAVRYPISVNPGCPTSGWRSSVST